MGEETIALRVNDFEDFTFFIAIKSIDSMN